MVITTNKKAYFDYFIEETFEAGIMLAGSEVKSVKLGHINLADSFCFISNGEIILKNCHITPYEKGSFFNSDSRRDRKLLLHKKEINRLIGKVREKGYSLVPTKVYFSSHWLKVEIALAKGKHLYDKKQSLKEKDLLKQAKRDMKNF